MWKREKAKLSDKIAAISAVVAVIALVVNVAYPLYIYPAIWNSASGEDRIRQIIGLEATYVVQGQIDKVITLYADQAVVKDAGNQIMWTGNAQISNRYNSLPVFTFLKHDAVDIVFNSDLTYARATASTFGTYLSNGTQVNISGDQSERWSFERINGDWKITSFTYNLP